MATTHIRIRCKKCGYIHTTSVYGYIEDPIGIPFMECSNCNQVSRDKKHKEWVQMTPIEKFFAVSPKGNILALVLPFIPILIMSRLFENVLNTFDLTQTNITFSAMYFLFWLISMYIIVSIRANTWSFYDRLVSSLCRTKNEEYMALLQKNGKVYSEKVPAFIIFTPASKATIEYEVNRAGKKIIIIPSFESSINKI